MFEDIKVGDVHVCPLMLLFSQATYGLVVLYFFGTFNLNLLKIFCHVINFNLECLAPLTLKLELLSQEIQLKF